MTDDIRLTTDRLVLRALEPSDVPALWPFVSDDDFPRHMTWEAHRHPDETAAFIRSCEEGRDQGTSLTWGITTGGALAGVIGLHGITRVVRAWRVDRAELGYWVGPPFQNRGYATEAARAVLRHAFDVLGLRKVTVGCLTENTASRRVIEKLGFRLVGEQRDHAFRFNQWWNHLLYELGTGSLSPMHEIQSSFDP